MSIRFVRKKTTTITNFLLVKMIDLKEKKKKQSIVN